MVNAVDEPKRVHVIACGVLAIDLQSAARRLGIDVSLEFLPGGLHSRPMELRQRLQERIDAASSRRRADMIAVGYGVCGLGTAGLHARNLPLALPRVNDCIAMFLGSDKAYKEQFAKYPGTYYISAGWVEEKTRPIGNDPGGPRSGGAGCGADAPPDQQNPVVLSPPDTEAEFERLVAKHGRENAEAIRHFLTSWQRNYQRAAFIDTGAGAAKNRYAEIAADMARRFGWRYEELPGTDELLVKLIKQRVSDDDVLIVSPHHVTVYDAVTKRLEAVPVWEASCPSQRRQVLHFDEPGGDGGAEARPAAPKGAPVRLGLGIDAGGTYTDTVLYDFANRQVLAKAKALTTKWDLGVGIDEALSRLDAARLREVDMVAVSTTLATNAIVEGLGQTVGLLIMPPYGLFDPSDIAHRPIAVIAGRLEIDGTELAPIDADEVRRVARDMVDKQGVGALAVAGYASHNNPAHELAVKRIIRQETDLSVTCGHDVSEGLNYRLRASTAALNARIIPCLEALLDEVAGCLAVRGIEAPQMVVRSDGSLMSARVARARPIETILSGPAASVAGAGYLTGLSDALVVDVGGTTTDTATIESGAVRTCEEGASVGGWRTHVKALDMRTLGLGGDSHVVLERRKLTIGPRRVAPVAWLASRQSGAAEAIDWIERHIDHFTHSTRGMDLLALQEHEHGLTLTADERRLVELLRRRPYCAQELAQVTGCHTWEFLRAGRLESSYLVLRSALTPTDLLHVAGRLALWDAAAAGRVCAVFARIAGRKAEDFAAKGLERVVHMLATELLKKQLDGQVDPDTLDGSPFAEALIENALSGGSDGYHVRIRVKRPIIGIGTPVHCFLPQAARLLETEAVIPPDADVANAVGAITSNVCVRKRVRLTPNDQGRYGLYGVPDSPWFVSFAEAHDYAVAHLTEAVRKQARQAGTSEASVEIIVNDRVAALADGGQVFLGRTLEASLIGRPDLARLAEMV
jgi:N-methylhydantoinase A/oxoprolinase/acetone carboxylase beta subunit